MSPSAVTVKGTSTDRKRETDLTSWDLVHSIAPLQAHHQCFLHLLSLHCKTWHPLTCVVIASVGSLQLWCYTVCIYSTQHTRTQHTTKTYYEDTIVTHACHHAINRVTPHLPSQVEFHRPLYLTTSLASRLWPGWCCLTSFRILGSFDFK